MGKQGDHVSAYILIENLAASAISDYGLGATVKRFFSYFSDLLGTITSKIKEQAVLINQYNDEKEIQKSKSATAILINLERRKSENNIMKHKRQEQLVLLSQEYKSIYVEYKMHTAFVFIIDNMHHLLNDVYSSKDIRELISSIMYPDLKPRANMESIPAYVRNLFALYDKNRDFYITQFQPGLDIQDEEQKNKFTDSYISQLQKIVTSHLRSISIKLEEEERARANKSFWREVKEQISLVNTVSVKRLGVISEESKENDDLSATSHVLKVK